MQEVLIENRNKNKKRKGFTLVELVVVIGILLVLSVLAVVAIQNVSGRATEAANHADATAVARALNTYNSLHSGSPTTAIPTPNAEGIITLVANLTGVTPPGPNDTIDLSVTVDMGRWTTGIVPKLSPPTASKALWTVNP